MRELDFAKQKTEGDFSFLSFRHGYAAPPSSSEEGKITMLLLIFRQEQLLTEAVPLCHYVTFPPHRGGIFPALHSASFRAYFRQIWHNLLSGHLLKRE